MQPRRRFTSRCSSPSSRERSSGEKESGSSMAWGTGHGHQGHHGAREHQGRHQGDRDALGALTRGGATAHHGEGHTVDLMLVLRLVLPKGAVPVVVKGEGTQWYPPIPTGAHQSLHTHPRSSLKSMQPRENQSALLSYATPFCSTSGAMYPWVPLGGHRVGGQGLCQAGCRGSGVQEHSHTGMRLLLGEVTGQAQV